MRLVRVTTGLRVMLVERMVSRFGSVVSILSRIRIGDS